MESPDGSETAPRREVVACAHTIAAHMHKQADSTAMFRIFPPIRSPPRSPNEIRDTLFSGTYILALAGACQLQSAEMQHLFLYMLGSVDGLEAMVESYSTYQRYPCRCSKSTFFKIANVRARRWWAQRVKRIFRKLMGAT